MHPEWARTCEDCAKWIYDDDGKQVQRAGLPVVRPPGVPTPCHKCPKIPDGAEPVRSNAGELDDRGFQAYRHYLECRAVGQFPDDPIVRRNARIFRAAHDAADQKPLWRLVAMLGLGNGGRS